MEECTPKLTSVTQTQELADNPWPTVEGGEDLLLYSLPPTPQELCNSLQVFTSVHMNRGKLLSFSFSLSQRKGYPTWLCTKDDL